VIIWDDNIFGRRIGVFPWRTVESSFYSYDGVSSFCGIFGQRIFVFLWHNESFFLFKQTKTNSVYILPKEN